MLACRRACHPGLSAMAIDKACAWSRRRTQGPRWSAHEEHRRAGDCPVRAELQCRCRELSGGGTRPQGPAIVISPGLPAEALCLGG
jgi:hypothetical protein